MKNDYNEHIRGPLAVNISDNFGGVTEPGSKSLLLVDNMSSSRGGGWRRFVPQRCLLGKVGYVEYWPSRGSEYWTSTRRLKYLTSSGIIVPVCRTRAGA